MKIFSRPKSPLDRTTLGVVGTLGVAAFLLGALLLPSMPFVRGGYDYSAMFTEAGGLQSGDAVIVAGQPVGEVEDLAVERGLVRIDFYAQSDVVLPDRTRAEVKVRTLLGQKALTLYPEGRGAIEEDAVIPVERTVAPFDITQALAELTRTGQEIDTARLGDAFSTLASTLRGSSEALGPALTGLDRLSTTIASRDAALRELLERAQRVTGVLADRNGQITTLIRDGNTLFAELERRFDTIRQLLVSTTQVSQELSGLIAENRATIGPSLDQLRGVLDLLNRNRDNLAATLREAVPYVRTLGEAVSSGPFFLVYVQNLVPYDLKPDLFPQLPNLPGLPGGPNAAGAQGQPGPPVLPALPGGGG
jgi:phospholipid/cholesterol/gamma-HCH transport system substrate-binding protein